MTSPSSREGGDGDTFLQGLSRYYERRIVRFHTPGHRGGRWVDPALRNLLSPQALALDVSDVLEGEHGPGDWSAALREAEARASRLFRTERTRFLVNGTTAGIHAAVLALAMGSRIAFGRASHLSVYAAAALAGAEPVYIPFHYDPEWDIPGPLRVEEIARLARESGASLYVDTYPNYYGLAHPIGRLCELLDVPLIADEAHGSHFTFCPGAPPPALAGGAAVSVQSAHKTLQAMTQASFLHVRRGQVDIAARIDRALSLLQTTSPSPLLLASLEAAVDHSAQEGVDAWRRAAALAGAIRKGIEERAGLRCLDAHEAELRWGAQLDPARVVVNVAPAGWTGLEAAAWLRRECGIQVEMANQRCIVVLVSPGNTEKEGEQLVEALARLAATPPGERNGPGAGMPGSPRQAHAPKGAPSSTRPCSASSLAALSPPPIPPRALSLREALAAPAEWIPLENCAGRVAAEFACPYPPGIPVLAPGEEITSDCVEYLRWVRERGWEVRGVRFADLALLGVIASP